MKVLERIVKAKRDAFAKNDSRASATVAEFPMDNGFLKSLKGDGTLIIGEIKPRSPSAGCLLQPERLDEILQVYAQNCAAVSVLTDAEFFGGSFPLMALARKRTNLPVLCKDFIVSSQQIDTARNYGADAVLLIVKILDDEELYNLFFEACRQGLVPVVEVNDEIDIERIKNLPARIVLINNRNLETMKVDLDTTIALAPLLPKETIIISASGIRDRHDLDKLKPASRRFLIGTSLLQERAPGNLLQAFTADTRLKICGITREEDAEIAVKNGVDYLGVIFAESKRKVSFSIAQAISRTVDGRAKVVGVFQNQEATFINQAVEFCHLDLVQLHGGESQAFIRQIAAPVIKTFQYELAGNKLQVMNGESEARDVNQFNAAQYFLFDAAKESAGLETLSEPERLEKLSALLCSCRPERPSFIAGRINRHNIQMAINRLNPFAIDLCSGVESHPGVKSRTLIESICALSKTVKKVSTNETGN